VSTHKHTPGPWHADVDDLDPSGFIITSQQRPYVATVHAGKHNTCEANARLIAAVPELLEALIALLPHVEHHDSCGDHDAYNNVEVQTCGCGLDAAVEYARSAIVKATGEPV